MDSQWFVQLEDTNEDISAISQLTKKGSVLIMTL